MSKFNIYKSLSKVRSQILKTNNLNKQQFLMRRLLKKDLKPYGAKPILVLYFTPNVQIEIAKAKYRFIDQIKTNIQDRYFILIMPAYSDQEVRAELWKNGKICNSYTQKLFENNIFAFHEIMHLKGEI